MLAMMANIIFYANNDDDVWVLSFAFMLLVWFIRFFFMLLFFSTKIAYKFQKFQSRLLKLFAFIFSFETYLAFLLMSDENNLPNSVNIVCYSAIAIGIFMYIFCFIRGLGRIKQGHFKVDGKGLYNFTRVRERSNPQDIAYLIVIFNVSLFLFHLLTGNIFQHITDYLFLLITVTINYGLAMVWMEYYLLTYCKKRFKSYLVEPPVFHYLKNNKQRKNPPKS